MTRLIVTVAVLLALASPAAAAAATVFVPATASDYFGAGGPAASTGVVLAAGDRVSVTATGLGACTNGACYFDANGADGTSSGFLAPNARIFSLIGRVGSGPWRFIGVGPTIVTGVGELILAYNDDYYGDNEGGFDVTASRVLAPVDEHPSAPTVSYCAPAIRGWTFIQISPGQLEAGFWHDAIAAKATVQYAGLPLTFTGQEPILAALVPAIGLTCDQPWFVNGTYADARYALRGAEWEAAFATP